MSRGDNVQGILGAIASFWAKLGQGRVPRSASFFLVKLATFRQLRNGRFSPNLVTKRPSVSCRGICKDIFENIHFRGHFPPKSEIENRSNRHITQRLQVTGCTAERYCLLHVVVQGPGSFRDRPTFLYTTYDCGATGRQSFPVFRFWLFLPYKTPKTYLPVTSLQPRGYIAA